MGKVVEIFTEEAYQTFVKEHYSKNKIKRQNLLLEVIPDKMIARQMNDTRYISKFISTLLSNIVRADKEDDGINSKNLIPGNGKITSLLKRDWGMDAVWNDLILPRFERMNQLTNTSAFTYWNEQYQKFLPVDYSPFDSKRIEKKRIDHRHHAMDALVIACMTRDHVNLLNNQSAKSETSRYDLQNKLRNKSKETWIDKRTNETVERIVFKDFKKPWDSFTIDAKNALETVVISFKQNIRVINKNNNRFESYKDESGNLRLDKNGKPTKGERNQIKGENWAIRKPLHKETVMGKVNLRCKKQVALYTAIDQWENLVDKKLKLKIKQLKREGLDKKNIQKFFAEKEYMWQGKDISKPELYYFSNEKEVLVASRTSLNESFNLKTIESITDHGIQKILKKHLERYNDEKDGKIIEHPELAFSAEGIEDLNKNINELNGGKPHQPIIKVRTYEPMGNKFSVGFNGNKRSKYVVAATGTNLYFSIYANEDGKRVFETVPLNIVINRLKCNELPVNNERIDEKGNKLFLLFYLNPNDIVYVPTIDQIESGVTLCIEDIAKDRIYRFIDSSDTIANFVPVYSATTIFNLNKKEQEKRGIFFSIQNEFGVGSPQSKNQKALTGEMVKDVCVKILIDRLGNISI
jgi:CRISPR-associated endonuclease Csn1